jgi:hypothetical protein
MRDQVLDLLYQLPPDRFREARRRLAMRLRDVGCHQLAREVTALAEPSSEAWVLNLLSSRQPERIRLLARIGPALAASVGRVVDGAPAREIMRLEALRAGMIDQLVASGTAIAQLHAVTVDERALCRFLTTAATTPELAVRLQRGRLQSLTVELAPSTPPCGLDVT